MTELTPDEQRVIDAMKSLGATKPEVLKDLDQIAKAAVIPKGRAGSVMVNLVNKRMVRKVTRGKSPGYYLEAQV
jgi:DNA-binding IscR family transcriptional regulator